MPLKNPEARRAYHREYMRKRYQEDEDHRNTHKERVKKGKNLARAKVHEIISEFRTNGCLICDETETCCLSAHHRIPEEKNFTISFAAAKRLSEARLRQELTKCVCLCENCHRKVHAGVIELPT